MSETNPTLTALFTDIADAIREKTGDTASIVADDFPDVIRERLQLSPFEPEGKSYLTFSSPNSFTLKVNDTTKHWDGTLEYFASDRTWTTWDGTTALSSATKGSDNVLYLRGTGNSVITGDKSTYKWVLTGSDIACIGNIENLLDYVTVKSGSHPTMADNCYAFMFYDCKALAQAPALPATPLAPNCYRIMFYQCTSLTQAPTLPATTLADYCYSQMFYQCTSLAQAPARPGTTLADYCYRVMFSGCTTLLQAPSLPATTLADYCYGDMFYGCTSLTHAPSLLATTLAPSCYAKMFSQCTNLLQAPALPATTLTSYCYNYMFSNCTSLLQVPALPATTLADNCYAYMFSNCTSLTQVPALPATTLAPNCYKYMFNNCKRLKLSTTQTGEYTVVYRIPKSGTGTTASGALSKMFYSTGGTFTKGTPKINTTYYLSNTNTVIYPPVTLISFTIAGKSYQAEEGMTWGEWVNSDYNTIGATIQNDLVVNSRGNAALDTVTSSSQTINAYEAYSWGPYMPFPGP